MLVNKKLWHGVLCWLYKKKEIVVTKIWFSSEDQSLTGQCLVPSRGSYCKKSLMYVSAENFVRCCSQLAYIIMYLIKQSNANDFMHVSLEQFKEWMAGHKMYYHQIKIKFNKIVPKDELFFLTLKLKKSSCRNNMTVCYLQISGVIQGEFNVLAFTQPAGQKILETNRFFSFICIGWSTAMIILIITAFITGNLQELGKISEAFTANL